MPAVGIATVWTDALAIFILRAPAILLIASVCIAGPMLLCQIASIALRLSYFGRLSGPFATELGIGVLQTGAINLVIAILCVQAGLGAIGLAFGRGVVARLALGDARDTPSLRLACREAKARFGSLLASSLIYGACTTAGAVGINAVFCDTELDLRDIGRYDVVAATKALALRTLDAFVPSPGSPFAEFVPAFRQSTFADMICGRAGNQYRDHNDNWLYVSKLIQAPPARILVPVEESHSPALAISLASLGVLLLAEVLLRFTPIMTMTARGRTRLGAIVPVLHSIRFGIRHFGNVTRHVWLLRLVFVAAYSAFFILPVVLSQDAMPSAVRSVTTPVMGSWSVPLTLACHSLITALLTAFSIVYDARLVIHHRSFGGNLAHAAYDGFESGSSRLQEKHS